MSKKEKKNLIRILVSLACFVAVFVCDRVIDLQNVFGGKFGWLFPFALYLAIYVVIGFDVLWRALRNIFHGQVFDENCLMCVATLGAFALAIYRGASGEPADGFDEACAVLLFYQVGEFFQRYATGRSRKSISALMDIRPDYANVKRGDVQCVDPTEVEVGEIIVVNPGEKVPLDGVVTSGSSSMDVKALTGESMPQEVSVGSTVLSGSINLTTRLEVQVQKEFYDSTAAKILELVESAAEKKSHAENFITKFARYYTPTVVIVALLLAMIPGAVTSDWSTWIYRALSFLVVSCPCALVISIPLSFFAGIGACSKYGILVKGSDYIEKLNKTDIFVFDKTGTLTKGSFEVKRVFPEEKKDEVLRLAALAEQGSNHPIAKCIAACGDGFDEGYVLTNEAGYGVKAVKGDSVIYCGNEKLMKKYGVDFEPVQEGGTVVYVATEKGFVGAIVVADTPKAEAKEVVSRLNGMGCTTVMLTGDNEQTAKAVAAELGVSRFKASMLPQNKVSEVEDLLAQKSQKQFLCFVGDGINDAPVLMRADVGMAMGGVGSDAAIEASDVVLMKDDLKGIPLAKRIAKKTMSIVFQNIVFSLAVKGAILLLSALGITNMWFAVFGDVGVAVLAILNAMRVNGKYKTQ